MTIGNAEHYSAKETEEMAMKINSYLAFNGQCKQAFEFYQKVLGGDIVMMMIPEVLLPRGPGRCDASHRPTPIFV